MTTWEGILDYLESENKETAAAMRDIGDFTEVANDGSSEGFGHHNLESIVRSADGRFYQAESSGCSCGASGSMNGPFDTYEEARTLATNYYGGIPDSLTDTTKPTRPELGRTEER